MPQVPLDWAVSAKLYNIDISIAIARTIIRKGLLLKLIVFVHFNAEYREC